MITKDKILTISSSNSCFRRNLSVYRNDGNDSYLITVHRNDINLVKFRCDGDCQPETRKLSIADQDDNVYIIQAKFVEVESVVYLVALTFNKIQIYIFSDIQDVNLICSFSLLEYNNLNDGVDICAAGIASFDSLILVGGTQGSIYLFDTFSKKEVKEDNYVVFKEAISKHRNSVIDIHADDAHVVTCDLSNLIIVWFWENDGLGVKVQLEPNISDPCTCVCVMQQFVVAGCISGCLRIYNMHNQRLETQVHGHAKCITSLDVCLANKTIASVSEDCFVRVFKVNDNDDDFITHKWCSSIRNSMLVGVAYFKDGKSFAVSGYDSKEIHIFKVN